MKFAVFVVLVFLLGVSCASPAGPARPRPPGAPSGSSGSNPERAASQNLVEEGVRFLGQDLVEKAEDVLREAVTIDPTNGEAYYYLASALGRSGRASEAVGLLEKAENLLGGEPSWRPALDDLKRELLSD